MIIECGQVFASCRPGTHRRLRIQRYAPGDASAFVVDAETGHHPRHILTRVLHPSPRLGNGRPRRTGYALVPAATNPVTLERIEDALRSVPILLGPNALELLRDGGAVRLSGGEYTAMARAVLELLPSTAAAP
ncbi:hypothetical protein ACIP98_21040 [Streptomyces sp. NPDC088354]|uniref:hypothetical protein n=1 Tax=Streptomyces sp. NPDC088354 TaxID=3365856 RepID=UPI003824B595